MKFISSLIERKNKLRYNVGKCYYQYGMFCSTKPIMLILISCSLVVVCSLPLTSFPIFEKILAFLFQRIQVRYTTVVSPVPIGDSIPIGTTQDRDVFAYVQQIHINTTIDGVTGLSTEDMIENILQLPSMVRLEDALRQPSGVWNSSCLRLHRDPPSMKALTKRIKFAKGNIHNDLRLRRFYLLDCLFVSPNVLFDHGQSEMLLSDFSLPFQELTMGYPMQQFHNGRFSVVGKTNATETLSFVFTLFIKGFDPRLQSQLLDSLKGRYLSVSQPSNIGYNIFYKFSSSTAPAELIPLAIAYVIAFFYLWFSIAKLDLLRTRWGLAFSAVMNFVLSITMAIGICATFDVLPTTSNVSEIFPYIVILIGIENFWIITKAVMTTKKDLQVQERVARGLSTEGWYITKNLVVEILLLGVGYVSGVTVVQEFSVFALACYLSDFFLQMTFFTPILAVDTRRAEVGLPFTNRSAWKYAFYIDIEKPDGIRHKLEGPTNAFSAVVKVAFNIAKYRIFQRTVMVVIVIYFAVTLAMPIQKMVRTVKNIETPQLDNITDSQLSCWVDGEGYKRSNIISWLFLCRKHWPELMNYYFVHLNEKSLFILPQIDVSITLPVKDLRPATYLLRNKNVFQRIFQFVLETSKPIIAIFAIFIITLVYKFYSVVQTVLRQLHEKTDLYSYQLLDLHVPFGTKKKTFMYRLTNMTVDGSDSLACAFNNGDIYVWDVYDGNCCYHVSRKSRSVQNMNISRSLSTYSLPVYDNMKHRGDVSSTSLLPRAVWSLAYKSDVLIVGCARGSLEIYSLESEALRCLHESENETGIIAVQIISCLRFVLAHENGVIEFCNLKSKPIGHKRTSSLPNESFLQLEVTRSVAVSHGPIRFMEIAIDKIFVASEQGQLKVLRGSDDGGILLQSQLSSDHEITCIKAELSPEMVIVGTKSGHVYILNSVGQTVKQLNCVEAEVISITSDEDYIAVLSIDCQLFVWLKEGYVKWWQLNLVSYGGAYQIDSLARYTLAAVSKGAVTILNIVSRTIVSTIMYGQTPSSGLILAQPVVCQNKSSIVVPSCTHPVLLKFPKLVDRDR